MNTIKISFIVFKFLNNFQIHEHLFQLRELFKFWFFSRNPQTFLQICELFQIHKHFFKCTIHFKILFFTNVNGQPVNRWPNERSLKSPASEQRQEPRPSERSTLLDGPAHASGRVSASLPAGASSAVQEVSLRRAASPIEISPPLPSSAAAAFFLPHSPS